MDEETKKLIQDTFNALPKEIQEAILSSDYENTLISLGNKYKLTIDKMGVLETETTLVMLGLTKPEDFEIELTNELQIDKITTSQIVKDINEKVFLKIREAFKLMYTPKTESTPTKTESVIPTQISKSDNAVLNNAGINIVEPPSNLPVPEALELESPERIDGEVLPMLAQKLSGYVQNDVAVTKHSAVATSKPAPIINKVPPINTPNITSYPKGGDPYRINPE